MKQTEHVPIMMLSKKVRFSSFQGPKRIKEKPCINCKKSQEELKHERIRKLEEMLKKADDDLLFLNNAISIPILDA